jgi:hypothetical protein
MTIDQLALATEKEFQSIHKEFRAIREEVATKAEMREGFDKVNNSINDLRRLVESLTAQVSG